MLTWTPDIVGTCKKVWTNDKAEKSLAVDGSCVACPVEAAAASSDAGTLPE